MKLQVSHLEHAAELASSDSTNNRCKDRHHSLSATRKRNAFSKSILLLARERSFYVLVLRRGSHIFIPGKVSQKIDHFRLSHLARMSFAVIKNEATNPICVGPFGTDAEMFAPNDLANLIQ